MTAEGPKKAATTAAIGRDISTCEETLLPGLVGLWPFGDVPELISFESADSLMVGRDETCDVILDEESVSRGHSILRPLGKAIEVTDLGSSNGTRINEVALEGAGMAVSGDLVCFGRCIFLAVKAAWAYQDWRRRGQGPIIGGLQMEAVRRQVESFGPMNDPVLVTGETGTGKEVIARALHDQSNRKGDFIAVNCAAIPDRLFESQFFGHLRGAFTGADRAEPGFLRAAKGGTIFLDEVGELELASQPKLLRALEAHEVIPLGATKPEPIDVRVVSATNRDLSAAVSSGGYRADLYSRIRVLSIPLLPLNQRLEDIALLTEHFLRSLPVKRIEHKAIYAMLEYSWPGNARELRNVLVEAAAAAAAEGKQAIRLRHLRAEVQGLEQPSTSGKPEERISAVIEALKTHKGNVARAAEELGLHRAQVYKALRAAGIKASQFRDE